jgi:hypothetical protein
MKATKARIVITSVVILGGVSFAAPKSASAQEEAKAPVPSTQATPIAAKPEDDSPDHERFIGHFGVEYFGIQNLPIGGGLGTGAGATPGAGTVAAPIIGGRYWLQRNLGIDAGLGFGSYSSSSTVVNNNTTTTTTNPSSLGFILHGGVPIAFAEGHHYTFELVPEANLGFTSGTIKAPATAAANTPDTSLSGLRIDIGARVGAEIHFGFIGVPELALEGSVGLYLDHQSAKSSQGNASFSTSATQIATTVGSSPWAIFNNTISALYYF